uniref:Uncharacterized protein n=1 Tax=viral metagenome TaxID=1070528 RepID=A0A6C0EPB1_9ZZZZ
MGNQPSSPSAPPPPPTPAPPPLPPPCDLNCQKQKDLALLKTALDTATENQSQDPEGYEKARIAYNTLLSGQGWLNTEKQRIATEVVEPVLKQYRNTYDSLKGEKKSQAVFTNLSDMLKSQEEGDQSTNTFLKKEITAEKDRADVLNRLNDLNVVTTGYLSIFVDVLIALFAIGVLYIGYTKFISVSTSVSSVPT